MTLLGENFIGAEGRAVGVPPGDEPAPPPGGSAARSSLLTSLGVRPLLIAMDLAATFVGVVGVEVLGNELGRETPAKKIAVFGLILLGLLWAAGMYRSRLSLSVLDDLPTLTGRWLAAVAISVVGQVLWSKEVWHDYLIDWHFLWGAIATLACLVLFRALGYFAVRRLRASGRAAYTTLVVGSGEVGQHVAEILLTHLEYGLRPIGFVDDLPPFRGSGPALPVLGGPRQLPRLLAERAVRVVVVAFSSLKESEMVGIIRACDRAECEVFVVPRLYEIQHVNDEMDNAWGLPLIRLRRATYRSRAWRLKRLFDVVVSGGLLLFLSPLLLLISLAVLLDGGRGILFRQKRVGVDGHTFEVLKFRSLRPVDESESATNWSIAHDHRLSPVGRFLRKASLDELPQLLNVLRGDMSLVGPRPERPYFVHQFEEMYPSYRARHRVPSGLTGWAQVNGLRGNTSISDRACFDNYYIENWSLWLDVKILLRTIGSVLRGSGG